MDWRVKAVVQMLLSAAPGGTAANERLQRLVGNRSARKLDSQIRSKRREIGILREALGVCGFPLAGARVLEIGTGWAPYFSLYLSALGARVTTLDVCRHLRNTDAVRRMVGGVLEPVREEIRRDPFREAALAAFLEARLGVEALLDAFAVTYRAPVGDDALLAMPPGSFDLVLSIAVLEHVPPDGLELLLRGQAHVLGPEGMAYHDIGLGDHFAGVDPRVSYVHFLQHDGLFWRCLGENRLAYHNRLRRSDFERRFREHGFEPLWLEACVDPRSEELLRTGAVRVAPRFAGYAVADLATWRYRTLLRRTPAVTAAPAAPASPRAGCSR